ncbi:MAG: PAS domain S-box protein [Desulfarculaceae bacterium]|nr:PAS domain S-box protein [Desulfarculaceae bacterium]
MKKFHLSTCIFLAITFLVIVTTLVTAGTLYIVLSKSLTSEFEDRVKAECGEVMQVLENRFDRTESRLKELSLDNTIRVTLMLGVDQQLSEYFKKKYGKDTATSFFLSTRDSGKVFSASAAGLEPDFVQALLLPSGGTQRLEKVPSLGFVYHTSRPVFRQKTRIGTAAVLYILKNDKTLLKSVTGNNNTTIVKLEDNRAWDLLSGKRIRDFSADSDRLPDRNFRYAEINGKRMGVARKEGFPDLRYVSGVNILNRAKKRVLRMLLYSSVGILAFTIGVSVFLSRLLSRPLSQVSKRSLEMSRGKADFTDQSMTSNIIEVQQLMSSLTTMVRHLRETEELKRYQQLFEGVADPVFICDFTGKFIEVNRIARDQFTLFENSRPDLSIFDITPEKEHNAINGILNTLQDKDRRMVFETELFTGGTDRTYAECHAKRILFRDRDVVLSVVRDITDRKKAEEALYRSEERLSMALEVSLTGVWELNLKTGEFELDRNQFAYFGYAEDEYPAGGKEMLRFIEPSDRNRVQRKFNRFVRGESADYNDEFIILTKNGEKRWLHNRGKVVRWESDGSPVLIIGTAIDISELKWAEQALRENEERYRTILDNRNIGYFEVDLNGSLHFFNNALSELTGYSQEELFGMKYQACTGEETSTELGRVYQEILETGEPLEKYEYPIEKKDGGQLQVETSVSLMKDANGRPVGFRGLTIDISERKKAEKEKKKLEDELRQAHKMEAIGTLAGGIAHDFNNILSGIFGYSQLALRHTDDPAKSKEHIEQIIKGAQRATGLIHQILTFSRQSEHEKRALNISVVVKESLKLLRSSLPSTIEIRENIASRAKVLADPTQIHQVVMNLCTNAYHAMRSSGGVLNVDLTEVAISDKSSVPDLNIRSGKYLRLEIRDTGQGMDNETLRKVFDPYFTTKAPGEGTGLGLSLVYGIVEDHGGCIRASSTPGEGTSFQVFLPLAGNKTTSQTGRDLPDSFEGGSETIMVVDDEEGILVPTREFLQDYGYTVDAFSDGAYALEAFENDPGRFDLVITDMTMPRMTGDELAVRILEKRNDLPVILCSGYNENISGQKVTELGVKEYMKKPVDNEKLARMIRDILDGRQPEKPSF